MKRYRKSIRVDGRLISKVFYTREAAERWYIDQKHKKIFTESGTPVPFDDSVTLNSYFDFEWFPERKRNYRKATYIADQQRYNDYLRQKIGKIAVCRLTLQQARAAILDVTVQYDRSIQTRKRVRSLLYAILRDAINRPEPLLRTNPIENLHFPSGPRGSVKPYEAKTLTTTEEFFGFMKAAQRLSPDHHAWATISLMTGMRAGEVIALRWGAVNFDEGFIEVRERFLTAEGIVHRGTKAGEFKTRKVPLFDQLRELLLERRAQRQPSSDDFILTRRNGKHWDKNVLKRMCREVCAESGSDVTPHGLRHSFAREYNLQSNGNIEALQAILGHAWISQTHHYSNLGIERLHDSFRQLGLIPSDRPPLRLVKGSSE